MSLTYTQTARQVISDLILENDLHPNDEAKLSNFMRDALRELNNDSLPNLRYGRWDLPSNRILKLPSDFIDWVKIGVVYKEGVKALAENPYLAIGTSDQGLKSLYTPYPYTDPSYPYYSYSFGMWGPGSGRNESYGNGGDLGGFKLDAKNKVFNFSTTLPLGPIYLECISDCMTNNDNTSIHPYTTQWVKTYVMAEYYLRKRDPLAGSFASKAEIERHTMRKRIAEINPETIVNIIEQQFGANE
jgi:hypothetical protein